MGCNVLRGPRPAAWDQEPPSTEEGLPDADWSTWIALQCEQNCLALQCKWTTKLSHCLTHPTHTHPVHTHTHPPYTYKPTLWQPLQKKRKQNTTPIPFFIQPSSYLAEVKGLQHCNPLSTTLVGSAKVYANHPWSVTEPEAVGVPGWQTGAKALCLYSQSHRPASPSAGNLINN